MPSYADLHAKATAQQKQLSPKKQSSQAQTSRGSESKAPRRGAPTHYKFADMAINESFVVTLEAYQARNGRDVGLGHLENSLRGCARTHRPKKFSMRCRDGACIITRKD